MIQRCKDVVSRAVTTGSERVLAAFQWIRQRIPAWARGDGEATTNDRDKRSASEAPISCAESSGFPIQGSSTPSVRVIVGPRPDAGTAIEIELESWPEPVREVMHRAGTAIDPVEIEGRHLQLRRRHQGVELRAPGEARILLREVRGSPRIELQMGARAPETLGVVGFGERWIPWVHRWCRLVLPREGSILDDADRVGWRVSKLDLAAELEGLILTAADQERDRWTGRVVPDPTPGERGQLHALALGRKDLDVSMLAYRKDIRLQRLGRGTSLVRRWWDRGARGPMMRIELRFRRGGLRLRLRGAEGDVQLDLTRLPTLTDARAHALAWGYGVGHPGHRSTGLYRLVVPGRGETRTRAVDPRWIEVQRAAGISGEVTPLARSRARELEAAQWIARAQRRLGSVLAQCIALDDLESLEARHAALEHARRVVSLPEWDRERRLAQAEVGDLVGEGHPC